MGLMVAVPILRGSRRIQIITALYQRHMAIDEEEVVTVGVRWFGFSFRGETERAGPLKSVHFDRSVQSGMALKLKRAGVANCIHFARRHDAILRHGRPHASQSQ